MYWATRRCRLRRLPASHRLQRACLTAVLGAASLMGPALAQSVVRLEREGHQGSAATGMNTGPASHKLIVKVSSVGERLSSVLDGLSHRSHRSVLVVLSHTRVHPVVVGFVQKYMPADFSVRGPLHGEAARATMALPQIERMTGDPRNLLKCAEIVLYALRLFTAVVADAFYRSDLEGLNELMQTHLPVVRRALMHILSLVAALSTAEEEKFAPVLALLQHVVLDFSALEEAVVHAVSTAPGGAEASPESEPKYEPKPYQKVVVVKGRRSAVPLKTKNKSASWLMRTGGAALALLAVLWVFRKRRPSFVDALGLHLRNRFDRGREFGAAAAAALRVITDPPPPYSPPRSPFIMPTGHPISAAWGSPSPYFAAGDTPRVMPSAPPPP